MIELTISSKLLVKASPGALSLSKHLRKKVINSVRIPKNRSLLFHFIAVILRLSRTGRLTTVSSRIQNHFSDNKIYRELEFSCKFGFENSEMQIRAKRIMYNIIMPMITNATRKLTKYTLPRPKHMKQRSEKLSIMNMSLAVT